MNTYTIRYTKFREELLVFNAIPYKIDGINLIINLPSDNELFELGLQRNNIGNSYRKTHLKLYKVWTSMKSRCKEGDAKNKLNYYYKGIRVCEEWQQSNCFMEWALNNGYKEGLTIDRIDVKGNYQPDNCRWITHQEQCNNTSYNVFIEYNGKTQTIAQWAAETGLPYASISRRYKQGLPVSDIFKPIKKRSARLTLSTNNN